MQSFKDYMAVSFTKVKGMSSRTAAIVCAELLSRQTAGGMSGAIVEIGTYEGRFFIALGLAAQPREKLVSIDIFTWPDEGIQARFLENCRREGLDMDAVVAFKASSGELSHKDIIRVAGGQSRFMHVDGAHLYDPVSHDLRLAKYSLQNGGIICTDDVLHPQYPELTIAVTDWLKSSPDFHLFAIIDRESFAASAKFLICKGDKADEYKSALATAFPESVMTQRARMFGDEALIIRPMPAR